MMSRSLVQDPTPLDLQGNSIQTHEISTPKMATVGRPSDTQSLSHIWIYFLYESPSILQHLALGQQIFAAPALNYSPNLGTCRHEPSIANPQLLRRTEEANL